MMARPANPILRKLGAALLRLSLACALLAMPLVESAHAGFGKLFDGHVIAPSAHEVETGRHLSHRADAESPSDGTACPTGSGGFPVLALNRASQLAHPVPSAQLLAVPGLPRLKGVVPPASDPPPR